MEWINDIYGFLAKITQNLGIGFVEVFKLQAVSLWGYSFTHVPL